MNSEDHKKLILRSRVKRRFIIIFNFLNITQLTKKKKKKKNQLFSIKSNY